jgi:hypothetical protein
MVLSVECSVREGKDERDVVITDDGPGCWLCRLRMDDGNND